MCLTWYCNLLCLPIYSDLQTKWNETKRSFERFENSVLSTKVFLHKWAAKNLYFSAVHDRVMSLKDHVDLQVYRYKFCFDCNIISCVCSWFYQWYQWYTNIVQGYTNGTIGNTIGTNGNANGTICSPNDTVGTIGKPMVPLVSQWCRRLPMVQLGEPRTKSFSDSNRTFSSDILNMFHYLLRT